MQKTRLVCVVESSYDLAPSIPPGRSTKMPTNFKTVVFICTANYYRSRFSEYLFNALTKERGLFWRATSRGLRAWKVAAQEGPISEFAAYRLTALDVPFDRMRFPIQLSDVDLEDADLVIALKKTEHHAMMVEQFPAWADRITYWHINDLDCATADEALPICESCVRGLVERLLAEQGQSAPVESRRAA
jgi:protein-tyrosine phosphatase